MTRRTALFLLLISAWCPSANALTVGPYVLTNLGDLSGGEDGSFATGINSYGQVVGWSRSEMDRGFLWQPNAANGTTGSLIDLGSLRAGGQSYANGINSLGRIVGFTSDDPGSAAYVWTPIVPNGTVGSMAAIGGPPFIDGYNWAYGVNSYGQVFGAGRTESGETAFLWTPTTANNNAGSMVALPGLVDGYSTLASGINSFGQVVGVSSTPSEYGTAVVWRPSTSHGTSMTVIDLPRQLGHSAARAINDSGQVVGSSQWLVKGSNSVHATMWAPTTPNGTTFTMVDLGAIGFPTWRSVANAVNSRGEVVGTGQGVGPDGLIDHAFYWEPNASNGTSGVMIDLNDSLRPDDHVHWILMNATGINDFGQIAGNAMFDPDGPGSQPAVSRAFLLTLVPEPQTITLFGLYLALEPFSFRRRLKRRHKKISPGSVTRG